MRNSAAALLLALAACGGGDSAIPGALTIPAGSVVLSVRPLSQPATLVQPVPDDRSAEAAVVADFDGDGRADVATLTRPAYETGPGRVSIRLADATGRWAAAPAHQFDTLADATGLIAADFTGDGKLDLIVSSQEGFELRPGLGDGNFGDVSGQRAGDAFMMVAADFDGDGRTDLAAAGPDGISVLLGGGDGTFSDGPAIAETASRIAARDMDANGSAELAVLRNWGDATVVIYASVGTNPAVAATLSLPSLHLGNDVLLDDVDGDGIRDVTIATVNDDTGTDGALRIYRGQGALSFSDPMDLATSVPAILAAATDFDGDGRLDIAWTGLGDGSDIIGVFRGTEAGFEPAANTMSAAPSRGLVAGPGGDLVLVSDSFHRLSRFAEPLKPAATLDVSPTRVAIADLNGDGQADLAAAADGSISVLLGDGQGGFGAPSFFALPSGTLAALLAADTDGDGRTDLFAQIDEGVYRSADAGATWAALGRGIAPAIGDIDRDGMPDVVAIDPRTGQPGAVGGEMDPVTYGMFDLVLTDLDGDGDLDAVVLEGEALLAVSYRNDGGALVRAGERAIATPAMRLVAGDFDRDGRGEVVAGAEVDPAASLLLRGLALESSSLPLAFQPTAACDLDGDGTPDLVGARGVYTGLAMWAISDGSGGFRPAEGTLVHSDARSVATGDLDGDGVPEIAAGLSWSPDLSTPGGMSVVRLVRE